MKRSLIIAALIATFAISVSSASAAWHAGCGDLPAGSGEHCSFYGTVRNFQLYGTGKFTIGLPGGWENTSHYISYRNWSAFIAAPWYVTGHPYVRNEGCCYETYRDGWVW